MGRYASGRGIPFLFSNQRGWKCFTLRRGGHCGVLLCANKYVPSDTEDRLVLAALLADRNKRFVFIYVLLLLN